MRPKSNQRIRSEIIRILYDAIGTTIKLAENEKEPNRPKWYQTLGYLSQTINGLLQNADSNETKQQLAEVQKIIAQLQDGTAKGKTSSGTTASGQEPVQDP